MALIDDIETYGRAVDAGEMDRNTAAAALAEATGGGLTLHGAAESIENWQIARGEYVQAFSTAAATMDKIYGLDHIQP